MLEHKAELASILTQEQGKPLAEATGEVVFAASFFHFFSEEVRRPEGELISASAAGSFNSVLYCSVMYRRVKSGSQPWLQKKSKFYSCL